MVNIFGDRTVGEQGPRGPRGQDGATVDPTSTYETYVKYINLRRKTIHSILGLVKITSNLTPTAAVHNGNINSVLESVTTRDSFYWLTQSFKDKYIAFEFQKPVWLEQIEFVIHSHTSWTLHFTWQYSDDGTTWEQIGNEYNKDFTSSIHPPVQSPYEMFTFPQETPKLRNTRHAYWRMLGQGGNVTNGPYVNAVFIDLTL